jgi:ABC-type transporter Mla subunit MlaD
MQGSGIIWSNLLVAAVLLAIAAVASLFLFGGMYTSKDNAYAYYFVEIDSAISGVSVEKTRVKFNGIDVGRVEEIALNPNNASTVEVVLELDATVPINVGASVSLIRNTPVLGLDQPAFIPLESPFFDITGSKPNGQKIFASGNQRFPKIPFTDSGLEGF